MISLPLAPHTTDFCWDTLFSQMMVLHFYSLCLYLTLILPISSKNQIPVLETEFPVCCDCGWDTEAWSVAVEAGTLRLPE